MNDKVKVESASKAHNERRRAPRPSGSKSMRLILQEGAYWRAPRPRTMDEPHQPWKACKCAAKSDSSTFTLQIKVSTARQLDYQMTSAPL